MPEFIGIRTERYKIYAQDLTDAKLIWREYTLDGAMEDDVEYLDGTDSIEVIEGDEDNG